MSELFMPVKQRKQKSVEEMKDQLVETAEMNK